MNKLQSVQLMILKDVDKICAENDLNYFLIGGTLLGAVRHKGFIPWDDDVDIAMYRNDYNKFIDIMTKYDSERYFVQNFKTDNEYIRYITKIRLNGTKQVESEVRTTNIHHGIYIDVFPLDYISIKNINMLRIRGKILKYLYLLKIHRIYKFNEDNGTKSKLRKFAKFFLHIISLIFPRYAINYMYDYICTATNNKGGEYTTSFASGYGWKKQLFPNYYYGKGTFLEFEGCKFRAPAEYDMILKSLFNNYMELPPESKRKSGHNIVELDFGNYATNKEYESDAQR